MPIQTVTEINQSIKVLLENGFSFITVIGEISNLRKPYSGHLYFSLKDEKSQIKAVLFKMQQRYLSLELEEGLEVICHGRISVYEPRGEYQLIIDSVDFRGQGVLQVAFEKLKQKLADEGLFDRLQKKRPPLLPEKIAVITSPQGAAIQDFLKIAGNRCPSVPIDIYPVRVQGESAAGEICQSLDLINKNNAADVIVLCRGGGSIEDLWPFNDETLARTIYSSRIPIISAIGHEIDFTISDFTADVRAPTPTAAAEAALPDSKIIQEKTGLCKKRMAQSLNSKINFLCDKVSSYKRILGTPVDRIRNYQMQIDYAVNRLGNTINTIIQGKIYRLAAARDRFSVLDSQLLVNAQREQTKEMKTRLRAAMTRILEVKGGELSSHKLVLMAVSPLAVLDRGYAIVQSSKNKKIIKSITEVAGGDTLDLLLSDGKIQTRVLPDQ